MSSQCSTGLTEAGLHACGMKLCAVFFLLTRGAVNLVPSLHRQLYSATLPLQIRQHSLPIYLCTLCCDVIFGRHIMEQAICFTFFFPLMRHHTHLLHCDNTFGDGKAPFRIFWGWWVVVVDLGCDCFPSDLFNPVLHLFSLTFSCAWVADCASWLQIC